MTVRLEGMTFHAFHGCLESERIRGNTFRVDVEFDYDALDAAEADDLALGVNYSIVYDIVRSEMMIPSNLLESVALRIKKALLARFPDISRVSVSVAKHHPPVAGECEWSIVKF